MDENGRWVSTELGPVWKPHSGKRKGPTPHATLRAAARKLLKTLEKTGNAVLIVPQFSGKVRAPGRNGAEYAIGRPGTADDLAVVAGRVYGLEYKAGSDRQRETQERWQGLFERAGGTYVIVRKPSDALDAVMQDLSRRGKIF